ncbi:MAG: polysaccharide deacetylase family protein [Myxococcales bacterium]|nr:polysaccharide deacetylase family protein [Myxococcales bacterium]
MGPTFFFAAGITTAAAVAAARLWRVEGSPGVAVLLYHRLRTDAEWDALVGAERNFSIPERRFDEQLRFLRERGATFLSVPDVLAVARGERPCPPNAVCITFDDGSESVLTRAADRLQALGVPGAVFVTTDPAAWVFEDQPRLTEDQLRELRGRGWHLGAHGVSHHGLNEQDADALRRELADSRGYLESLLRTPVTTMAVPLNFYDDRVLAEAARHGYDAVFTANPGRIRAGSQRLELPRIAIEGGMDLRAFERALSPSALLVRRVIHRLKRLPPRVLGEARWMPLRRALFESPLGRYLTVTHLSRFVVAGVVLWAGTLVLLALSPV